MKTKNKKMKTKSVNVKMIEALSFNQLQLINGGLCTPYYSGGGRLDMEPIWTLDDYSYTLDFISYMEHLINNPIDDGGCINIY